MTNANRAVLFSIIGLCVISIIYRFIPREVSAQKTTLYFDLYLDEKPELQTLIARFEEQNPDITVVPLFHTYGDLATKLINPPPENLEADKKKTQSDLVLFDIDWLPNIGCGSNIDRGSGLDGESNLVKTGILEPLADFPKDDPAVNMLYETSKIDGISRAIPLFSSSFLFFYNIDILKAAGFDRPPKTRDDFLRYSRALKEKQIAGIGFALSEEHDSRTPHSSMLGDVYSWFWNSHISFIKDNGPQFSSSSVLETFRFLETLSKENLISPASFAQTESQKIEDFCGGKTAMMIAAFSSIPDIAGQAQFEWGISSVPAAASYVGNPLFVTETFGMGIYAQSEQKESAWKFLAFLAGAEQNAEFASAYFCLPKNQNAEPLFAEISFQVKKALELFHAGKEINEFDLYPGVFSAEKSIRIGLQSMMSGGLSPELAAQAIAELWED